MKKLILEPIPKNPACCKFFFLAMNFVRKSRNIINMPSILFLARCQKLQFRLSQMFLRWVLALLVLLALPCSIYAAETVKVGAFEYYPGIFRDSDGQVKGFFVDLLKEIARQECWELEFVYGGWNDGLERIQSGEIDIVTSVAYTDERATFMDYCSEPIFTVWSEVYVSKDSDIENIFDLKARRIGLMKGDYNAAVFQKHAKAFKIDCKYYEFKDYPALFSAIRDGKVDAGAVNSAPGAGYCHDYDARDTNIVFDPFDIYYTVAKGKNSELRTTIDKYISSWKEDNQSIYYKGLRKWLEKNVDVRYEIPAWVKKGLWALAGLCTISLLGLFLLRRIVRRRTAELARSNQTLQESEQRYRTLFERSSDAVFLVDVSTGKYVDANAAAEKLTGRTLQQLKQTTTQSVTPDGASERLKELSLADGALDFGEVSYYRPDGEQRVALLSAVPFKPPLYFGIARDITQRKNAEKTRISLQQQLTQAQKMESVGRLAGGVAHDFNNMLTLILGHAEMLHESPQLTKNCSESVDIIKQAAMRSSEITGQLLAFARRQEVSPRVVDINKTTSATLSMLQRLIGENISLDWQPGKDVGNIKIDPAQFDQILANLAVNARDAINDTGSIIVQSSRASFDRDFCDRHPGYIAGDFVRVSVIDDGCGIDDETKAKIFEPFYTTKGVGEGTGLGLATIYGIVQQNGGFIDVESQIGKGSAFHVFLPFTDDEIKALADNDFSTKDKTSTETILLVEDEPAILKMITRMLKKYGYNVICVSSPLRALEVAGSGDMNIDMLITDIVMPEMNGKNLAEKLAEIYPGMKSMFMSGYTADIISNHGVLEDDLHFIQKPFAAEDLVEKVRAALDS